MMKEDHARNSVYRFLQTKAGRTRFARVEVTVTPGGDSVAVVNDLPEKTAPGSGELARGLDPSWETAALDGIREALGRASRNGTPGTGCRVDLVRVIGSLVDTTPDAIRCAAALATWRAFDKAGPEPELFFDGGLWSVRYPPTQPSPAEGVS
jgi:hypothetical protein